MAVTIEIQNQQKRLVLSPPALTQKIQIILKSEGIQQGHLVVVFGTDRFVQGLNRRFLAEDGPTDVLAFDMSEGNPRRRRKIIDGEIAISVTTAFRQAKVYHATPAEEVLLYVIHGILHLLGYDDQTAAASKIMRAKEREWLAKFDKRREPTVGAQARARA